MRCYGSISLPEITCRDGHSGSLRKNSEFCQFRWLVQSVALSEYSSQQVSLCVQRRKVYRWLSLAKDPKEELLMPDNPQGPNKESTGTNKQCSAPQNTSGKWSRLVCNFSENLCYSQEQNKETNEGKGEGYSLERKIKDA